jgi:hypothetical protein
VCSVSGGEAEVRSRPLVWDGQRLALGEPTLERVVVSLDSRGLAEGLRPGAWCSMHWDWVCEALDARSLAQLRHYTVRELAVVNGARIPAPASVLS